MSLLADVGHEVPTALLPNLLTSTLGAPASALGLIEGISDGLAGLARLGGGALSDDPARRRAVAVGGYTSTTVLASATGAATAAWHVGALRAGAIRGSAFGLLAAVQGFGNFAASAIAGLLWTSAGPSWAFAYLAGWMVLAAAILTRTPPRLQPAASDLDAPRPQAG